MYPPLHVIQILEPVMVKRIQNFYDNNSFKTIQSNKKNQVNKSKQTKENKQNMHSYFKNSNDLHIFLASGKSFSHLQYMRPQEVQKKELKSKQTKKRKNETKKSHR